MNDSITFLREVTSVKNAPSDEKPNIVITGRSNVGKSSIINALFNKKGLAKTSSTPGKTRALNFYNVNDKYYLVDLPGFGYAKASKVEQDKWKTLINNYFEQSKRIRALLQIIDSRHEPTELDLKMSEFVSFFNIEIIILLNKIDKLKQSQVSTSKKNFLSKYPEYIFDENVFMCSATTGFGIKKIMKKVNNFIF